MESDTGSLPNAEPGEAAAAAGQNWTTLQYRTATSVSLTQWINGTFALQDSCNTGGCVTGTYRKEIQLQDLVPEGAPTRLRTELTFTDASAGLSYRPIHIELESEDATVYNETVTSPRRALEIGQWTLLKGPGPLVLGLYYYAPHPAGPSISYSVRIDVESNRGTTPGGVPVELALEPAQTLVVETASSDHKPDFLVYGGQGVLLERVETTQNRTSYGVPSSFAAGRYVLMFAEGVQRATIQTNGTTSDLRALALDFVMGAPKPVVGPAVIEWEFQVDRTPLVAGLYTTQAAPLQGQVQDSTAELSTPAGILLEGRFGCGGVCLTGDEEPVFFGSDAGDSKLVPGSYKARWDPSDSGAAGFDVGEYVVYFVR